MSNKKTENDEMMKKWKLQTSSKLGKYSLDDEEGTSTLTQEVNTQHDSGLTD